MTRATTLARLENAMSRLLAGQPTCTDGDLTVSNLCAEAGVGRDSYYRSKQVIDKFTAARANAQTMKPEVVALREELAVARRQLAKQARQAAQDLRSSEETIKAYASQIQLLALRNAELEAESQRLRSLAESARQVSRIGAGQPRIAGED